MRGKLYRVIHVLFVCSQNKLRSPTAEQIFADWPGVETASAGTNHDAEEVLTAEWIDWADIIFVMEKQHRSKVQRAYRNRLGHARLICLDIPDDYGFMEPALIQLLEARVTRFLPAPAR